MPWMDEMVINIVGYKNTLNSNSIKNVLKFSDTELFIFRRWQESAACGEKKVSGWYIY